MEKNLKKNPIISCILIIILFSCAKVPENNNLKENLIKNNIEQTLTVYDKNDWKEDSIGCLKKRSRKLSEQLIKKYHLEKSTLKDFQIVFGKPNKKEISDSIVILSYYFDSFCKDGNLNNDMDYCIAEYHFKFDTLDNTSYICF